MGASSSHNRQASLRNQNMETLELSDLQRIRRLGAGSFGSVDLVQVRGNPKRTYALKQIKKSQIVRSHLQRRVITERMIMAETRNDFLVKLVRTFRDSDYVYILMENCPGGDITKLLKTRKRLRNAEARFYMACLTEAVCYLQQQNVAHRDLKPENLLLDKRGYLKVGDFGCACKITHNSKTRTFCGTYEYMAPEIVLNKEYDSSVDFWAMGVIMFEFLAGYTPFKQFSVLKTFEKIVSGIDTVPFPETISRHGRHLIRHFCRTNPGKRIGFWSRGIEIKGNRWFEGFRWTALSDRLLVAPHVPNNLKLPDILDYESSQHNSENWANWDAVF